MIVIAAVLLPVLFLTVRLSVCTLYSSEFRNWWLVGHLTDLLHHQGILEPQIHRCASVFCMISVLIHSVTLTSAFSAVIVLVSCYSIPLLLLVFCRS